MSSGRISTGLLLKRFYALREQQHLTKAEALRQAQLTLLQPKVDGATAYSHLYYWAPFILMGNWL